MNYEDYEKFRHSVVEVLYGSFTPLSWSKIRKKGDISQEKPPHQWVKRLEEDINLVRERRKGRMYWSINVNRPIHCDLPDDAARKRDWRCDFCDKEWRVAVLKIFCLTPARSICVSCLVEKFNLDLRSYDYDGEDGVYSQNGLNDGMEAKLREIYDRARCVAEGYGNCQGDCMHTPLSEIEERDDA